MIFELQELFSSFGIVVFQFRGGSSPGCDCLVSVSLFSYLGLVGCYFSVRTIFQFWDGFSCFSLGRGGVLSSALCVK